MKTALRGSLAAAAIVVFAVSAFAAGYPERAVTVVMPYPPGGSGDMITRLVADKLSASLGQAFIVENRAGAAGAIGTEYVANAKPDGYTLLVGQSDTLVIGPVVNKNLSYKPLEAFDPISILAYQPFMLLVGPTVKAATLAEFIEEAKANPGAITCGSNGVGGLQHLAMELFNKETGVQLTHVPYKGAGPALADVIGGHIGTTFGSLQMSKGNIAANQVRPLAATSPEPIPAINTVASFTQLGFPNLQIEQFYGLCAPAGTPPEILDLLNKHTLEAIKELTAQLNDVGTIGGTSTADEFRAFLVKETEKWTKVANDNNITVE